MGWILIALVRLYQVSLGKVIMLLTGGYGVCRFSPSCSNYMIIAIRTHGVFKGVWLGILRIFRCNPFFEGGYDPVPGTECNGGEYFCDTCNKTVTEKRDCIK